jgi:hypothetical protein
MLVLNHEEDKTSKILWKDARKGYLVLPVGTESFHNT